jgi:hypothetical protein
MRITTANNINTLLVQEDVEGLIAAGAPLDEYRDEAAQIAAAILLLNHEQLTKDIILSTISLVWLKSFELPEQDMKLRISGLEGIARQIIE